MLMNTSTGTAWTSAIEESWIHRKSHIYIQQFSFRSFKLLSLRTLWVSQWRNSASVLHLLSLFVIILDTFFSGWTKDIRNMPSTVFYVYFWSVFLSCGAVLEQCRHEFNIQGMALNGFIFKKFSARGPHVCDDRCDRELTCQSFNYVTETNTCELNNRTKEARPENFKPDPARFYIRRLNNRGDYSDNYIF